MKKVNIHKCKNLIIGSGAAAYNAALRLNSFGKEVSIITECRTNGTSRNTGSDKQTYYKLTSAGNDKDSVYDMALTYFNGKSVDGDICLVESANSMRAFMNLVEEGVSFPQDRYGQFIGYKTDHDIGKRATSVGPLTSKSMTEQLEESVIKRGIQIYDYHTVFDIIVDNGVIKGVLCIKKEKHDEVTFEVFLCNNAIFATGGPAGLYKLVSYPNGHWGMSGVLLKNGCKGRNLTEWQYGMASLHPKWNVSGTYMQVIPTFVSTNKDGSDKREFLNEYFKNDEDMMDNIFLKGYQWPFSSEKSKDGSSVIDLLVYRETQKRGRKVYLDFTRNPNNKPIPWYKLSNETLEYLKNAQAQQELPIERLLHMNKPAYEFYLSKGVDLKKDLLEIDVCAQHNNGGLAVDVWWETNIENLYAVGELAATHGVNRPGGSALNAGQVGSLRAALSIANKEDKQVDDLSDELKNILEKKIDRQVNFIGSESNIDSVLSEIKENFTKFSGPLRNIEEMKKIKRRLLDLYSGFDDWAKVSVEGSLRRLNHLYDTIVGQLTYVSAMINFVEEGGKSRGSAIYLVEDGQINQSEIFEGLKYHPDDGLKDNVIQEIYFNDGNCRSSWRERNPIPVTDQAFETVWRGYRENRNIY